jgi:hypothetical protein
MVQSHQLKRQQHKERTMLIFILILITLILTWAYLLDVPELIFCHIQDMKEERQIMAEMDARWKEARIEYARMIMTHTIRDMLSELQPERRPQPVEQQPWHDEAAQHILAHGVWAYNMYRARLGLMATALGNTDVLPQHINSLDPRNMPTAEQAEKAGQENMIQNIKLITMCAEKLQEWFFTAKWNAQQAYYRYRSERARDVTPKRVVYLDSTWTAPLLVVLPVLPLSLPPPTTPSPSDIGEHHEQAHTTPPTATGHRQWG